MEYERWEEKDLKDGCKNTEKLYVKMKECPRRESFSYGVV